MIGNLETYLRFVPLKCSTALGVEELIFEWLRHFITQRLKIFEMFIGYLLLTLFAFSVLQIWNAGK